MFRGYVYNVLCMLRSLRLDTYIYLLSVNMESILCSSILFYSYYGLTMWFPTLFDRLEESSGQSVCDLSPNQTLPDRCDHRKEGQVYFDTLLQAISTLPGNLLYFLFIDRVGRKLFVGG